MSVDSEKLLEQALRLPGSERLRLAERLLETFDGEPDPDAHEAWEREIARRSREIDEGLVEPISWSEVKRTLGRHVAEAEATFHPEASAE